MHSCAVVAFLCFLLGIVLCAPAPQSTEPVLRIQTELDRIDVSKYLKNERLIRLQFKCLIFDGPCDIVGRWAKPRAKGMLLGRCDYCTETQKGWIADWYDVLVEKFPDMYRAAVAKYIQNEGIEISPEEKKKIEEAFRDESLGNYFENVKTIDPKTLAKSNSTSPAVNEVSTNSMDITSSTTPASNTDQETTFAEESETMTPTEST